MSKRGNKDTDAKKFERAKGAAALDPAKVGDADANKPKVEEANERSGNDDPPLNEPAKIDDLVGGAGALPGSLEPAAQNARAAQRASDTQAEVAKVAATKPENVVDVYRKQLREIADYVGPETTARVLGNTFGTSDPDQVGAHNLVLAIDELHKAADAAKDA